MKYRFLNTFRFIFFLCLFTSILTVTASAENKPPKLNAEAAILMDADTGDVLYSKKGYEEYYPASTTKVLTALVVLDHCKLNDVITVGKNPPYADGSSIGLREGEKFTTETLLTGLLLESGNDCAQTLAEHVAGSEEKFAIMMNEKAKSLGATHSNFENASGLPNDKHKTTAYDLALILRAAIKNPDFVRISQLVSVELPKSNLDGAKRWANNHNHLINPNSRYYYKYALAGKSGYTNVARHTFVISGRKDGRTLVAAFLKAEDKNQNYKDMAALLNYGFNNFTNVEVYKKGQVIETPELSKDQTLPLITNEKIMASIPKSEKDNFKPELKYELPKDYKENSYTKGEKVTTATLSIDGKDITTVDLVSGEDVELDSLLKIKEFSKRNSTIIVSLLVALLLIIFLIRFIVLKKKRNAYKKKWKHVIDRHNKY